MFYLKMNQLPFAGYLSISGLLSLSISLGFIRMINAMSISDYNSILYSYLIKLPTVTGL